VPKRLLEREILNGTSPRMIEIIHARSTARMLAVVVHMVVQKEVLHGKTMYFDTSLTYIVRSKPKMKGAEGKAGKEEKILTLTGLRVVHWHLLQVEYVYRQRSRRCLYVAH
jgi:hypothetical protein